jgi:hypothetical protein
MLLRQPGAWTVKQLGRRLGYPAMSLATLARRVREQASWRRPRLVAKGDPEEATVLAALHQEIATLPEGAVILAEDESHVNLLPWLRSTWIVKGDRQEVMTPGTNEKRSIFGGNCDAARLASTRSLVPVGGAIEALRHRLSLLQTLLRRQTGRSPLVPDRRVPILPHGCSRRSDRDAPRPRRRPGPGGARCGPR